MIENVTSQLMGRSPLPLPHGVRAGDYVFVSGQIAVLPDGTVVTGDAQAETRAVLDNVQRVVEAAGGSLADVCKVTVFLADATLFGPVNDVYAEYFRAPFPARSAVLAPLARAELRIEIEAIAYIPR